MAQILHDITQDPSSRISLAELQRAGQINRVGRVEANEAERQQEAIRVLRDSTTRNTVIDPETNKARTNHDAVANDLRRVDPAAAQAYLDNITKRDSAAAEREMGLIGEAISAVDENQEDQEAAAAQYGEAVNWLESQGVTVSPADRIYSKGRVQWMRRRMAGAEKTMGDDTERMKHSTPSGTAIMQEEGEDNRFIVGEINENYRHDTPSGTAIMTQEENNFRATLPARSSDKGGTDGSGEVSFLPAGTPVTVTSRPGRRKAPMKGASTDHRGTDYAAPEGTPILSEDAGVVVSAGPKGGYGNQVRIRYADGREVSYSHAKYLNVRQGQRVIKGQPVGAVGQTGTATGPHVHKEDHGPVPGRERVTGNANMQEGDEAEGLPERYRAALPGGNRGAPRRPQRFAPQAAASEPTGTPRADSSHIAQSDVPRIVAEGVLNYRGGSNLTKQGEISTRTHPQIKRLREVDVDARIDDLQRVSQLLSKGDLKTGAGTNIQQYGRRFLQGVENLTGFDASSKSNDNRVAAYEILQRTSTLGAIESLRGVGGNDTDRDFDRALNTTVNALRSQKANAQIAGVALAALELGREKLAFYERWANVAGSVQKSIDGTSVEEAWASVAEPKQRAIISKAQKAGLMKGQANSAKDASAAPKAPTGARTVRDKSGNYWFQYPNGQLRRAK